MSVEVETIFYTKEKPWHGLGTRAEDTSGSGEALELARLDWQAIQGPIVTTDGQAISGLETDVRNVGSRALGVVTDRYKVVQNGDALVLTDQLLGEGVTYGTTGLLQSGRRTWLLVKLPRRHIVSEDEITSHMVSMNTHGGMGTIRVAMTSVRVVCTNAPNLAPSMAKRPWSTNHIGDIMGKMEDVRYTLLYVDRHMSGLGKAIDHTKRLRLSER